MTQELFWQTVNIFIITYRISNNVANSLLATACVRALKSAFTHLFQFEFLKMIVKMNARRRIESNCT